MEAPLLVPHRNATHIEMNTKCAIGSGSPCLDNIRMSHPEQIVSICLYIECSQKCQAQFVVALHSPAIIILNLQILETGRRGERTQRGRLGAGPLNHHAALPPCRNLWDSAVLLIRGVCTEKSALDELGQRFLTCTLPAPTLRLLACLNSEMSQDPKALSSSTAAKTAS